MGVSSSSLSKEHQALPGPQRAFQAASSQTAETQLEATTAPALSLGTLNSTETHSLLNIAGYKRRNIKCRVVT